MLGSMKVTTPAPPWIQPLLSVERCVEMAQLIKFQSVHSSLHALCCVGRHDDVLILLKLWFPFPPTKLEKAGRFRHKLGRSGFRQFFHQLQFLQDQLVVFNKSLSKLAFLQI
jgi:hypothetical protein